MAETQIVDNTLVIKELNALIREHGTQARAAEVLGFSPSYLSYVRRGKFLPSGQLLQALGLVQVITFRKAA